MIEERADQRLAERWSILVYHWTRLLGAGLVCGIAALVVSLFLTPVYRATTYILVSESRIGDSPDDTNLQQMAMLATFIPFVDSDSLIRESLESLGLDQPPHNLTVDLVRRRNYLDVRAARSTRLLEVTVELPDARLAADLANEMARGAVKFNDRLNSTDMTATQAYLMKQLDEAREAQERAAAHRLEALEEAGIEDQEAELSILLAEKDRLSVRLAQLRLDRVQNQSRVESLEEILRSEPEVVFLTKNVTSDRLLEKAAEAAFPEGTPLSVTEESINETREAVRRSLIDATVARTAGSAELEAASSRLQEVNEEISGRIDRITRARLRVEAATEGYQLAVEATRSASREYQTASVTVGSKTQDMKQIAPALPPEHPVRPNLWLNAALGFLLGALLAGVATIAIHGRQGIRDTSPLPEGGIRGIHAASGRS